jgi:hypothetical protein
MTDTDTATVRLLNYPLKLSLRSRQHFEELIREFQLVDMGTQSDDGPPLPVRLQQLVSEITTTYKAKADEIDALRAPAIARGDATMDLVYDVPAAARTAIERLDSVLEEADEFCRQGEHLLTLATPTGAGAVPPVEPPPGAQPDRRRAANALDRTRGVATLSGPTRQIHVFSHIRAYQSW